MTDDNKKKHNQDSPEQEMKKNDPDQDISPQRENDTNPKQNDNHK
ncbi:hypothetical protein ACFOGI_00235 [Virgibacillus xinjiangensis]|uniref:3-methyladenine DNA glycosylase n=1 Tax=Virgibacillus xinjiangensis TaxID=393090 RepID=A0ABV7CQW3_9BACI